MQSSDFGQGAPGILVPTTEGVSAFVPNPLPPNITPDFDLMRVHGNARAALGRLEVCLPRFALDPYLLAYPLMSREAYYSSLMEGTYTTPEAMALFRMEPTSEQAASYSQTKEVVNYIRAIERGVALIKEDNLPICHRLIKALHESLLDGVRGERNKPGRYRETQNFIGRPTDGIAGARFVPPPPVEAKRALDDLEAFVNNEMGPNSRIPTFVGLALFHYQFETIHPFEDGNGRIGRLLIPLILIEKGVLTAPLLHMSPALERRKADYNDRLLAVSQRGDWKGWIIFFLEALEASANDAVSTANRLWELRAKYLGLVQTPRAPALLTRLVDALFKWPSITINKAKDLLNVTHPQAAAHIRKLENLGIVRQATEGRRNLRFIADEILDLVFDRD